MKWLSTLFLVLSAASCRGKPKAEMVALHVTVSDLMGDPLSDIGVEVDNKEAGKTNETGSLQANLTGKEGRHVAVSARCPEGFLSGREAAANVTLRFLRSIGNETAQPIPLHATLFCTPVSQQFVLIVKTNQQKEIPIIAQGRTAGKTDLDGAAQAVLSGPIGEEIEVVLNTEDFPELSPKSPARRIVIPAMPQILLFEQDFKVPPKGLRKRRSVQLGPKRI